MNVEQIVNEAIAKGVEAANATDDRGSNGSEAWQSVVLRVKGERKIQNQLKKLDTIEHDSYYGYTVRTLSPNYGYFKEEAYTTAVAKHLNDNGISARRTERLL